MLAILLLIPAAAFGEAIDFVPTIYSTGGSFDLTVLQQNEKNTTGGRGTRTSDSLAVEQLHLYLGGFVYHPRLIQFFTMGDFGLYEERYDNNTGGSFSQTAFATNYEFRTKILPEHPYNLELYTLSMTPYTRQATAETRATDTEKGAIFNYARKPLFLNLSYNMGETKTRVSSSEFQAERATGTYLIGPVRNTAMYSHTDTSMSVGMKTSVEKSSFENFIFLRGNLSLTSKIAEDRSRQKSLYSPGFDTDALTWLEQFNAQLPWNFSTFASYNFVKYTMTTEATASAPQRESFSDLKSYNFSLSHKLYDSVQTNYAFNQTSNETSSGNSKSTMNSLNGVYTKKIPDGRFTIGAQGSRSRTEQENAPLIVGETYNASLFNTFTISRSGIDPATISIKVLDMGALVDLVRNINYIVEFSGNSAQITIIFLPQQVTTGHPIGYQYTFNVTYSLLASTVEFQTTTVGYSVNLALFENLILPYYNYLHTTQDVLNGSVPGGPQDTQSDAMGIIIQKAPYRLLTESRTVDNKTSPSRSLKNAVEYAKRMSDTLDLAAKAEHLKTIYGQGALGTKGYTEQISDLSIVITKNVPRKNLTTSVNATYSQRHAMVDTNVYTISSIATWRLGELFVNLSASLSRADSTGVTEKQTMMSEYYYLNVSRKLF